MELIQTVWLTKIFEFANNASMSAVLTVLLFLQWYLIFKNSWVMEKKDKLIQDLIKVNGQQTETLRDQNEALRDFTVIIKESTEKILSSVWKTRLPEDDVTYVAKRLVLSACIEKIKFLEEQLELDDIEHNQEDKKKHIKSHLLKLSRELYLDPLNKFTTKRGLVWDWIMRQFPFESFCDEIFRIFFDTKINRYKKRNLFLNIMTTYQNSMWEEFKAYLIYWEF